MDITSRLSAIESERALFALGAVISGVLTVLVFRYGDDRRGALMGAFTLYLGGAATPAVRDTITDYKRSGAMALAGVGIAAILLGTQSPLAMLFVIGGVAAYLGLF